MTYGFVIGVLIIALVATLIGVIAQSNETNRDARDGDAQQDGIEQPAGSEQALVVSEGAASAPLTSESITTESILINEQATEVTEIIEATEPIAAIPGDEAVPTAEESGSEASAREITTAELMAPITMGAVAIDARQDEDNEAADASITAPHMSAADSEDADESSAIDYQDQNDAHDESDESSTATILTTNPESDSFENVSDDSGEATLDDRQLDSQRSESDFQTDDDPVAINTSAEPDFVLIPADPGSLESVIEVEPVADAEPELMLDPDVHPAEDWIAAPENTFSEFVHNLPTGEPIDEGFSREPEPIGHIDAGAADWELTPETSDVSDDGDRTAGSDMEGKVDA